jgi:hypothetical protein
MDNPPSPNITSFVIRFVHTPAEDGKPPPCRGAIHHVQSNQEITFIHWADAVEFIQRFVPILTEPDSASDQPDTRRQDSVD